MDMADKETLRLKDRSQQFKSMRASTATTSAEQMKARAEADRLDKLKTLRERMSPFPAKGALSEAASAEDYVPLPQFEVLVPPRSPETTVMTDGLLAGAVSALDKMWTSAAIRHKISTPASLSQQQDARSMGSEDTGNYAAAAAAAAGGVAAADVPLMPGAK